jgi:hypothetical protein
MKIFSSQFVDGELWLRSLDGNIKPANIVLSSIYIKYEPISTLFYNDLTNNLIVNFDVFYDSIYIETETGFIFEKISQTSDNQLVPFQNNNNFIQKTQTPIDYWLDEESYKIYFVDIKCGIQSTISFSYYVLIYEYDINTGIIKLLFKHLISLALVAADAWGGEIPITEKPKICFNKDTKRFNVSFVFRNGKNKIGIVSMNFSNNGEFIMEKIKGVIPFVNSSYLELDQNLLQ